jgi:hypothetical protein
VLQGKIVFDFDPKRCWTRSGAGPEAVLERMERNRTFTSSWKLALDLRATPAKSTEHLNQQAGATLTATIATFEHLHKLD